VAHLLHTQAVAVVVQMQLLAQQQVAVVLEEPIALLQLMELQILAGAGAVVVLREQVHIEMVLLVDQVL